MSKYKEGGDLKFAIFKQDLVLVHATLKIKIKTSHKTGFLFDIQMPQNTEANNIPHIKDYTTNRPVSRRNPTKEIKGDKERVHF